VAGGKLNGNKQERSHVRGSQRAHHSFACITSESKAQFIRLDHLASVKTRRKADRREAKKDRVPNQPPMVNPRGGTAR